jgi:uncharacterized protein (TIGR02453 family)
MIRIVASPFTARTPSFLRALKRHNDRDWFRARKDDYERHVRGPMIEVLARLSKDLRAFAPEVVSDPRVSLFRIYRDTRFSSDKSPLKTAIGGTFQRAASSAAGARACTSRWRRDGSGWAAASTCRRHLTSRPSVRRSPRPIRAFTAW